MKPFYEEDVSMNYNQNESGGKRRRRNADEAELFAEILARLDEKQNNGSKSSPQKPGSAAQADAKSIDLIELFYFLVPKLHLILLGTLIGAVLLGFYATVLVTPIYSATSKLYIIGEAGSSILSDLQIGTELTMDYQEVFKTWEVHQMVNDELGTNYGYSELQDMISVSNPTDTHILSITVTNTDSTLAADIANAYITAAKRFITQTMNTDEPNTFSIALVPGSVSGTGVTGYIIRGMLLGTVLGVGALVLVFLLDNRPKSPEDIMSCANIPILAVIPDNPQTSGKRSERHHSQDKAGGRKKEES